MEGLETYYKYLFQIKLAREWCSCPYRDYILTNLNCLRVVLQAQFTDQHFDQDYNFCAVEEDPVTKKVNTNL